MQENFEHDGVDRDEKPPRGFEPEELPAIFIALGVGSLPVLMAVVAYTLDEPAVWPMGIGAGLVALGLWGGIRGAVGCGVLALALGGMIMTSDASLSSALLTNAVVVVVCLAVVVGADLSFTLRRGSRVAPDTVQGFALVHGLALGVGVVASILVVGVVEAINWPSWLIVVPIAGLTIAAVWLVRRVRSYRSAVRAADAPVVGRGPAPPGPDSKWRDFRWQSGDS